MYQLVLQLLAVFIAHPVGLGYFFAEKRCQILNFYSVLFSGLLPLTLAGNGVGGKVGALPFKQIGYSYSESQGTFMNKGERKIKLTVFVSLVIF